VSSTPQRSSSSPIAAKAPRLRAAACTCSGPSSSSRSSARHFVAASCAIRRRRSNHSARRWAGELGDLEFEIDRGRGVGISAHSNQIAAGAEEGNAGLENREILAEVAPQLVESFGHRRFELDDAGGRPRRHNPCERSVRRAHKSPARRIRRLRRPRWPTAPRRTPRQPRRRWKC